MFFSCPIHLEIKPYLNTVSIRLSANSKDLSENKGLCKSVERDMVSKLLKAHDIATDFKGVPYYDDQNLSSRENIVIAASSSYIFSSIEEAKKYTEKIKTSLI